MTFPSHFCSFAIYTCIKENTTQAHQKKELNYKSCKLKTHNIYVYLSQKSHKKVSIQLTEYPENLGKQK